MTPEILAPADGLAVTLGQQRSGKLSWFFLLDVQNAIIQQEMQQKNLRKNILIS